MENNLMENLNKEQLGAVLHKDGPLLIVAGAGTGKTTVITQKIAYLIEQGFAKSEEILALTFTEKVAGEMEERVDRLLPIGYLDLWISTFHSFAERILKAHGLDIGLPSDFKLLNEFEQWILIKKNLDKFNLDYYRPAGNPTKFINALLRHFSRLKDEDISPVDYLKYAEGLKEDLDGMLSGVYKVKSQKSKVKNNFYHPDPAGAGEGSVIVGKGNKSSIIDSSLRSAPFRMTNNCEIAEQETMRINEVANAYHVYRQLLLDEEAMDFGDLINYVLKLFRERPGILEKYKNQFKYILVDEFQDTNWAQYELVKMLTNSKNNLTVVGDDDQSIYRFRGASMSNILQFKKDYPKANQIVLTNNYRNQQNILDLSYEFIKLNNPNRLEWRLSQKSVKSIKSKVHKELDFLSKKLVAQEKGEGEIEVIQGEDLQDEVAAVINKIADLKIKDTSTSSARAKTNWSDFAILVRANDSAKEFCNALEIAGLPYQFYASRGLYAKPVIMDIVAYLNLLDNYHESKSLYRVLNLPVFEFSYQELVNFNYWAYKKAWSLHEVLKSAGVFNLGIGLKKKIDKVLSLIEKHTSLVREKAVSEIVIAFLNDSGYLKYLISQEERKSRETASYLNQFMKRVKTFEAGSDEKTVKAFLEELNMEIKSGEEGALAPDIELGPDTIKVMTVHAAKGLEFKYVFIVNMVDKRFPTIERHDPIAIPDALVKEILPEGDVHIEEERRLFYVAMTRAKNGLYFSWGKDYGGARKKKPSRFLAEIGLVDDKKNKAIKKEKIINDQLSMINYEVNSKSQIPNPQSLDFKIPSHFSYSQLAAFSNCPYQYRFAHILKIPMRGKAVFSFGKTMHGTLQKLFELVVEKKGLGQGDLFSGGNNPPTPLSKGGDIAVKISFDEILNLYEKSWIDDWYESKAQKEEYRKKGKEILKGFYEKYKDNWPNVILTEKGFNIKLKSNGNLYTVRGVIDRIDKENDPEKSLRSLGAGKIKIVDYKTGAPKEKLSFEEKEQLLIYQIAVKDLFREEVGSLTFYYLDDNSEQEFLGSTEDLEKVKEKIIKNIEEIKKGEFPPKPSQLCKFCDFFDICEFRKS
jgi:DNA helicase-2/ATP-dependent DNA helicase PcrA